jgi:hypothetical protein
MPASWREFVRNELSPAPPRARVGTMAGEDSEKHSGDMKSQFREALERKRGQHQDGAGGPGGRDSKIHEAHGKAAAKRQFRRKSG